MMANTEQKKRYAVKAEHCHLEMAHFLNIACSFVHKVWDTADGNSTAVAKCKMPAKCPNIIRSRNRILQIRITELLMSSKLQDTLQEELCMSVFDTCHTFMPAKTKDNHLIHANCLFLNFKHQQTGIL